MRRREKKRKKRERKSEIIYIYIYKIRITSKSKEENANAITREKHNGGEAHEMEIGSYIDCIDYIVVHNFRGPAGRDIRLRLHSFALSDRRGYRPRPN